MGKKRRKYRKKQYKRKPVYSDLLNESFVLQMGQYYPERHKENLKKLRQRYAEFSTDDIDSFYRLACKLGATAEDYGDKILKNEITFECAKEILESDFYDFSNEIISHALNYGIDLAKVRENME